MSEKVKTKVIELLYSWTMALPEEAKIKDAYHMLKRQGTYVPSLSLKVALEDCEEVEDKEENVEVLRLTFFLLLKRLGHLLTEQGSAGVMVG